MSTKILTKKVVLPAIMLERMLFAKNCDTIYFNC